MIGTLLLSGCGQLRDLDDFLGGKDKDKGKDKMQLNPLNSSGVSGTATVMMTESGHFEVINNIEGLAPQMVHPQHVHGFVMENMADQNAVCPPPSAAGNDGLLTLQDGLPFYGPVLIPLDDKLVPLTADNFPVATPAGTISYGAKVKTQSLVSAFDAAHNGTQKVADLELGKRVIVIHGAFVMNNRVVAPGTEGATYMATLPVACGELMEMK